MKRANLFFVLGIFWLGIAACNDEENKQLPVFTETVEFENTSMSFREDADTVKIPVILSGFTKSDVKVTISVYENTKDTTAVEGTHFILPQKTITIPAGKSVGEFPMILMNDNDVNVNRYCRLWISAIERAQPARISQLTRITIVNEDFWPEVQFSASKYSVTEHEDQLIIPMSALGIFYQPMDVKLHVIDGTAKQGVNFTISQTDFHFEDSARMNLVVNIPQQDLNEDLDFNLELEVLNGGITGKFKSAKVTIKDVRKIIGFKVEEIGVLGNANPLMIPVVFGGVRSSRDVTATISLTNAGGLSEGDYDWEEHILTSKGDTTLYAKLKLKEGVTLPDVPLEFEIANVEGGEISEEFNVAKVVKVAGKQIDPKIAPWEAVSWTTEEPTGDGGGQAYKMIDGQMGTFWHSIWTSTKVEAPYELVFDMHENIEIEKIGLYRRQPSNKDAQKAYVEVSMDKEHWTSKTEFYFAEPGVTLVSNGLEKVLPVSVVGRYLRVTITECTRNNVASLAELVVWGLNKE